MIIPGWSTRGYHRCTARIVRLTYFLYILAAAKITQLRTQFCSVLLYLMHNVGMSMQKLTFTEERKRSNSFFTGSDKDWKTVEIHSLTRYCSMASKLLEWHHANCLQNQPMH